MFFAKGRSMECVDEKSSTIFDIAKVKEKSFYQGNIVEYSLDKSEPKNYIILNQTCDLLCHSLDDEPFVELIEIEYLGNNIKSSQLQGFLSGKSTRNIVIEAKDGNFYKVPNIVHRITLPRERLLSLVSRTSVVDLRSFASWLGRKYDRVAYPDNFNELFPNAKKNDAAKAYAAFVKFVKKYDQYIPEIWVSLNNWGELPKEEAYIIHIVFIFGEHPSDIKSEISDELHTLIEGKLTPKKNDGVVAKKGIKGCLCGIEINDYYILEMHEFTRKEMDFYSLFNLDYISHASGESTPRFR
jgi:hypothetical protein